MGSDLHQMTIGNLRIGVNEAAAARTPPDGVRPWQAGSQITITGFAHPDGSPYSTMPDLFVCRRPFDIRRPSQPLSVLGVPGLIIEVLSNTTYRNDLDLKRGKAFSYGHAGVAEYLTLDPTGEFVPEQGRGWRLVHGAYRPWLRDPDGRWRSREFPIAFALEGVVAVVFAGEDRRMLGEGEIERERSRLDRELAQRDQEIAQMSAEIEALRRRLERGE